MDNVNRGWAVWLVVALLFSVGCSSTPKQEGAETTIENRDPLEGINRKVAVFNDTLDGWLLKPVAKGYRFVTPDPVETGVGNFFSNLLEVPSALNNVLQWKWKKAGSNTGRFLMNSTIGLAGLFDVAKHTGLEKVDHESFGQTLSHWGLGSGPYIVIPLLGPSTLTDIVGSPVDWVTHPMYYVQDDATRYTLYGVETIDKRARLLAAEELISGDRYSFIRDAFFQRREYLVQDGEVKDDFGGDLQDFDEDF